MTDNMIALARRAVACKGWRWMAGMLTHDGARLHSLKENGDECFGWADCHEWHGDDGACGVNKCEHHSGRAIAATHQGYVWLDQCLPDLTDPATLGCLLALVREAWEPTAHIVFLGACGSNINGWRLHWSTTDGQFGGGIEQYSSTEAEALVVALEHRAWCPTLEWVPAHHGGKHRRKKNPPLSPAAAEPPRPRSA